MAEWIATVAAVSSAGIAVWAAMIATRALKEQKRALDEQRRVAKHVANFQLSAQAEALIAQHKEILELHGLPADILDTLDLSPAQAAYLIQSFSAGDFYYWVDPVEKGLSGYRRALLAKPKVRKAWRELIADRFLTRGEFSNRVDKYVNDKYPNDACAAQQGDATGQPPAGS